MSKDPQILERIYQTILSRKNANPQTSYTASLFSAGLDTIIDKVAEESSETLAAANSESQKALIFESADLLFHLMILWAVKDIEPDEVFVELSRREGTSGLVEKASRKNSDK